MMNKIYIYYKKLPLALKASFWFLVSSVLQKGIAFIVTPFYTRLLTTEEYGVYSLYQSWMSIISIFATLNLSAGVFNNVLNKCKNRQDKDNALSNFQFIEIMTIVLIGMIVLIANSISNKLFGFENKILLLMFLQILMNSGMSLWLIKERFDYKYIKPLFFSICASILNVIFSLLFIKFGDDKSYSLIFGAVFASVFSYIGLLVYNLWKGKNFFDFKIWKYALRFNIPLLPHYLSMVILSMSDRIMIQKFCSLTDTSLYSVPYNMVNLITVFFSAINSSIVPWTYKNMKNENYFKFRFTINICVILVFTLTIGIVLVGPELLYIMGGGKYIDAKWVIPPASCGMFFMFLYPLFGNIEFYYEKNIYTMISSVVAAFVNIFLNLIFISKYGYVAAAYTTLFSYAMLAFIHYIFYRLILKKNNIKELYDIKFIFLICVINITIVPVSLIIYNKNVIRYSLIIILVFIFILVISIILKKIKVGKIKLNFLNLNKSNDIQSMKQKDITSIDDSSIK